MLVTQMRHRSLLSLILLSGALTGFFFLHSFDGDDFDDVEEDEGLDELENAEEVSI